MTSYLYTAASKTILCKEAAADVTDTQKPNFSLGTPSHIPIHITKMLELQLRRLSMKARQAFQVNNISYNLVTVATLVDAGCSVHVYYWGFEIEYNGEIIYKG